MLYKLNGNYTVLFLYFIVKVDMLSWSGDCRVSIEHVTEDNRLSILGRSQPRADYFWHSFACEDLQ